ncbi:DAK2 domain-containing protein [soil metagenome]
MSSGSRAGRRRGWSAARGAYYSIRLDAITFHPKPRPQSRVSGRTAYGSATLSAFRAAAAHLEAHVEEIDALNVFPVPDGDTGTNMLATVRSALQEADAVPIAERTLSRVAAAISFGALMGARGNSGVILSQILRGMAEIGQERRTVSGRHLAHGLRRGSETAYAAIATPVEGTILTVVREAAEAAAEAAESDPGLESVLAAAVDAAHRSVTRTPTLLPVLREAGVVDSGGQGLYRLLEGALAAMSRETVAARSLARSEMLAPPTKHGDADGWGYETMFLVSADGRPLDLTTMRRELSAFGGSVLVAGDVEVAKIHVHNDRPDRVIAYGLTLGKLSRITVENLDDLALHVAEAPARALTGVAASSGSEERPARALAHGVTAHLEGDEPPAAAFAPSVPAVVVVAAGEGLADAMENAGARAVVRGGQTASAGELMSAIRETGAREVIVLPNHPSVRLAAQQAAGMVPEVSVEVVPTRTGPEGVAALLAFDPRRSLAENAATMLAAARAVRTLAVTFAVRDARIGDRPVQRGQVIVLDADDRLLAADGDPLRAAVAAVAALEPGFELLTIYYGEDADQAEAERLAGLLAEAAEGVDVEILRGGQPHHRYLIAAE